MKIDMYCAGLSSPPIAGCGIILIFTDDYDRMTYRTFRYILGDSTDEVAGIQAARLALSSVKSLYRSAITRLYSNSNTVVRILEKNGANFVDEQEDNEVGCRGQLGSELRKWFNYYDNIRVSYLIDDDNMLQAIDLANTAMSTHQNSDSGTLT